MSSSDSEEILDDSDEDHEIIDLTGEDLTTYPTSTTTTPNEPNSQSIQYSDPIPSSSQTQYSQSIEISSTSAINQTAIQTNYSGAKFSLCSNCHSCWSRSTDPVPGTHSNTNLSNPSRSLSDVDRESVGPSDPSAQTNSKGERFPYKKRLAQYMRKYMQKNLDGRKSKCGSLSRSTKKGKKK